MKTAGYDMSVIIPVRNYPAGLAACVAALAKQETQYTFEVVVVDNNDRFCAADYEGLESGGAPLRVLHEVRRSSYAARNRGIRVAQGRVCAFTDADCIPHRRWLDRGMRAIQEGAELVGGEVSMCYANPADPTLAERFDRAYYLDQYRYVTFYGFAATANLFAPRPLFDTVGLFDGCLQSGGDKEWCLRAARYGYQVLYASEVTVCHPARDTWSKILQKAQRHEAGYQEDSLCSPWQRLLRHLNAVVSSLRRRAFSVTEILRTLLLLFFLLCYLQIWKRTKRLIPQKQPSHAPSTYSEYGER